MDEQVAGPRPAAGDQRPEGIRGTPISQAAGGSYREEAQRLIEAQTEVLFAAIEQALGAERAGVALARDHTGRVLTAGSGAGAVEFAVEAITDVPPEADPAVTFSRGQARCLVRVAGSVVDEWVLSRTDPGSPTPVYHWLRAQTGAPVTPEDIRAAVHA